MAVLRNPHDLYFREVFSRRNLAQAYLARYLPSEISVQLDFSTLHLESGTFIDAALREHFSDILYQICRTDGKLGYVYLLFEHKSYPDPDVAFQILRYKLRIWEQVKKARQKAKKRDKKQIAQKLPPIFPLLVYHGEQKWDISARFSDLIELSDPWRAYCPEFEYHIHDLSAFEPEEMRDSILLRAALLVMKHIFDPTLVHRLPEVLTLSADLLRWPNPADDGDGSVAGDATLYCGCQPIRNKCNDTGYN